MRQLALTSLVMCAFAANSVLNRLAVGSGSTDPLTFALVRLISGAAMLALILLLRRGPILPGWSGRLGGVAGLLVYLTGFSLAYVRLEAGTGALILFGFVQITLFAGALIIGEAVPRRRWAGAALAFGGLVLLLAPSGLDRELGPSLAMAVAGIGWGLFSLAGRKVADPLAATAANFVLAVPLALVMVPFIPLQADLRGLSLAIVAGAVTSGLGYALWYAVVPKLGVARAGVAQLTVPVLAATAGILWLDEPLTWRFALATALVMAGVLIANLDLRYRTISSRGS